jgi:hypothetical protein
VGFVGALLGRIPMWLWVVAVALGWGAWQRHLATKAHLALREREAQTAQATIEGLRSQLAERERIIKEQQHAGEQGARARDAAEVARLGALDAVGRLQLAARRAAAAACPATAASAGDGAASAAGPDVLADVLGRLAAAGGDRAAALDAARVAGIECEQRYDALRSAP